MPAKLLTSEHALERLCSDRPLHEYDAGLASNIKAALISGVIALVSGSGAIYTFNFARRLPRISQFDRSPTLYSNGALFLGFIALVSSTATLYCLCEAALSLRRPQQGRFFYADGMFTKNPSPYDRKMANLVTPIETIEQLENMRVSIGRRGRVFLNGVTLGDVADEEHGKMVSANFYNSTLYLHEKAKRASDRPSFFASSGGKDAAYYVLGKPKDSHAHGLHIAVNEIGYAVRM